MLSRNTHQYAPSCTNTFPRLFCVYIEDLDRALFWLEKASPCFRQAKEEKFAEKVDAHRDSIKMRHEYRYQDRGSLTKTSGMESKFHNQLQELIRTNLLVEANRLCDDVAPLLDDYTQIFLGERLIPFLPRDD